MGWGGITYSGLATLNISLGSGADNFTVLSTQSGTTTNIKDGTGDDTVNVQSTAGPTNIHTQSGSDVINIGSVAPATGGTLNGIQGALTVVGDGSDTMNVDDTGSTVTNTGTLTSSNLTGLGMGSSGILYSGLATLNLALSCNANVITVLSTQTGTATNINLQSTNGPTTITTQSGSDTINIGSLAPATGGTLNGIHGAVTVVGEPGSNTTVNVDDTGSMWTTSGTLTSSALTGLGMGAAGISYSGLATLNISLGSGANTFTVSSTQTGATTDINVQGTYGNDSTEIVTQSGSDVVNIGSLAPATGGILDYLQAAVTVFGDGSVTLNVDDSGSTRPETGTLTGTSLTGLGMGFGGITYGGLAALNISLGGGPNTFTIASTQSTTTSTLKDGSGCNTVNVQSTAGPTNIISQQGTDVVNIGSLAPATGGNVNGIQGALTVVGDNNGTMNVDDTGSTATNTGTLTGNTLTGLGIGPAGITYCGLANLNISLGSGDNTFTIASTNYGTVTTLNAGSGVNTINIQSTASATTVNTPGGANVINVGSVAPLTGEVVNNIQSALTIIGNGSDILNVNDADGPGTNGTLTSTAVTGLGMGPCGIAYSGLVALNIFLGGGGSSFTIASTNSATVTTLNVGNDVSTVNIQSTAWATTVNVQTGTVVINVGGQLPQQGDIVNNIQSLLTVVGNGDATLNVEDAGCTGPTTGTLTGSGVTGLGLGPSGIAYGGLAALNIYLGSGLNTFTIASTQFSTPTTLNDGPGNNTVNVQSTAGPTNIVSWYGTDVINIGSLAPATGGNVNGIQGALTVVGGNNTMNVDDTGGSATNTGTLTGNMLTGLTLESRFQFDQAPVSIVWHPSGWGRRPIYGGGHTSFTLNFDGADGGGRTHTSFRILDFESSASANSATSATWVLVMSARILNIAEANWTARSFGRGLMVSMKCPT
jgi:hypothetical protein